MPLSGAQPLYQRFSHRDLGGLLAQVVRLLLFCLNAAQNLGTPGILCHVDADCLHYGIHTAASKTSKPLGLESVQGVWKLINRSVTCENGYPGKQLPRLGFG